MKKLGVIQECLGSMLLSFRTKWNNRKPKVYTFENAQTVGILYDAINKPMRMKIASFVESIQQEHPNIKISTLGFVSNSEIIRKIHQNTNNQYFSSKDFTWSGRLQKGKAFDFSKKDFDILFDLTTETSYPIKYVALTSRASYKIGRFIENDPQYDLMIDTKKENTIEYLITQINVYLTQIKVTR